MNNIMSENETVIENLIYEIRGVQVILDSDLARLYECINGTKDINKAVKRNIERFPKSFMFQLSDEEFDDLRFQIGTPKVRGGRRYNPYVFTEQGVAMLSNVLHSEVAIKMSIRIINAFVIMKKFMSNDLLEQKYINNLVLKHDSEIKILKESFSKINEKRKINEIYFNGQIYDAYSKVQDIFNSATKKLIIIDSYADNTILDIIKRLNVEVVIVTKKDNLLTNQDILRYNKQYQNLRVVFNNDFHDRYFLIDEQLVYHCGTSINRIGYKTFSITMIGDSEICNLLFTKVNKLIDFNA